MSELDTTFEPITIGDVICMFDKGDYEEAGNLFSKLSPIEAKNQRLKWDKWFNFEKSETKAKVSFSAIFCAIF